MNALQMNWTGSSRADIYKLVDVYDVPKVGTVNIKRNMDASVLTLITCTYKSNTKQTVFIFELSNVE